MTGTAELERKAVEILDTIHDPCSIAVRSPVGIVELGLLVSVEASEAGELRAVLRMTSGSCVLIGSIIKAAEERLAELEDVTEVRVELDSRSRWSRERMAPRARRRLEAASASRARELGVRPVAAR